MERAEDQDRLLIQNSIKYLNNLTNVKGLNVPTLKSLYRTKCRLMELRRHIYLPRERPNHRCQRCFMNFSEGLSHYEVRPTKLSDFAKNVLRKVKNKRALTTFQRLYYEKLKKKFLNGFEKQNKMVITCNFCKKELEIKMTKPKRIPLTVKKSNISAKKKNKSKKDKLCGLNAIAVSQSASKKKKQHNKSASNISSNEFISTQNSNITPLNSSMSMANTRVFETADFIPLETGKKKPNQIKFSKKIENKNNSTIKTISKSKEKLQKKNLTNLGNILKKAGDNSRGNKNKQSSNLKHFLAGL